MQMKDKPTPVASSVLRCVCGALGAGFEDRGLCAMGSVSG